jgi:RNA-directed DNA polymerase
LNDEELGVKSSGTASDKHNETEVSVPPPLPSVATPVDEPIAGKPQTTPSSEISTLMAEVLHKENLKRALERVKRNKGAPGIDGMSVDELSVHLKANWPSIRTQLVAGTYRPEPVKRVEIPKPDGRKRLLGIPTVTDRFIQQALAQVVQRQWDGHFHPNSYGFRPGRNAHQATRHAQATIRQGYGWVVDIDLEAFFDRVNHDRLMVRVRQHVEAPDVLKLINRFLKGGVQVDGQTQATTQGVPQGGPLSPVLANVVLDELDWALERRGHRFARYADDCNIFVKSKRAGERLMQNITRYLSESLRLTVNAQNEVSAQTHICAAC